MSVGLILPSVNIAPSTEAGHTFAMLLLQKGKNYYNDDLSASTFDSTEAVQSFEEWTDFYTKYSFVQTYDAFSRFRTGEYPIVIANYTFYNQLAAASPEIKVFGISVRFREPKEMTVRSPTPPIQQDQARSYSNKSKIRKMHGNLLNGSQIPKLKLNTALI